MERYTIRAERFFICASLGFLLLSYSEFCGRSKKLLEKILISPAVNFFIYKTKKTRYINYVKFGEESHEN